MDGLVRNAAAAAGYAAAVTARHGHARWGDDPLLLPRIMVTDADDPGARACRVGLGQRAPLLRRYGFGATVFLVADLVGGAAAWDAHHGPPAPLMGWATIGRLAREGVAFGGHGATHPYLTRVGPDRLAEELRRSRAALEGRLGLPVRALAYPFGFVDGLVRNAAAAAGYAAAVTTRHGHARWGDAVSYTHLTLPTKRIV